MKDIKEKQRQFQADLVSNSEQQQAFFEIEKTILSYVSENALPDNLPEISANELQEAPQLTTVFDLKGVVQSVV